LQVVEAVGSRRGIVQVICGALIICKDALKHA